MNRGSATTPSLDSDLPDHATRRGLHLTDVAAVFGRWAAIARGPLCREIPRPRRVICLQHVVADRIETVGDVESETRLVRLPIAGVRHGVGNGAACRSHPTVPKPRTCTGVVIVDANGILRPLPVIERFIDGCIPHGAA